ncbi:polyprenol phosphomannose-dependent alpha 1,6 mannosyltransferase MptB [Amycolatopsis cynarae]|uniref:Polyprenol phosphomannose-dependent alpha 1,6 mannosyltransferase MptB n=1 Tax=Amycolatopsis cynarae TaxID=2995223 RepID=A0ABY7BB30_9PSEU|nr:polyprenol phosphomannose-dependent alpha 1,6 mannosyltransferase MptB [Amycolatopsis sp. HUAS 11-8]WAL68437.1 polyprenol phosphomannose-dependent alpha 1,6 mannosyltransferase MptB [Amycolatopsis sp. HUAS 11-8]
MSVRFPVRTEALPVVGFAGVVVLVLATAGLPVPPAVLVPLGLTGMGVVVLAWLGLGRRTAEIPVRGWYRMAAAWCLPLLFAPPLFSGDVHSYLAQGVIAAGGQDPYRLGPLAALGAGSPVVQQVSPYWQDTTAPYGPFWIAISRAIAQLAGHDLIPTLLLNRLVELAGVALTAWALPRLARRTGVSPGGVLWLGLLNPLVLWHVVAGAHNDGLMTGLMLAGLEIALAGLSSPPRIAAGLVLLTLAANIKIMAAAAVCCLGVVLARHVGRTAGRGAAVLLGVLGGFTGLSLAISWLTGLGLGWLGALGGSAGVHSWLAPTNQLGFLVGGLGALAGLHLTSAAISVMVRIGAVLGAIAGARLLWSIHRGRFDPVTGLGLVFSVMLIAGPVVQPWYLLWAILPLAASVRSDRARRVLAGVSAVLAMALPPLGGGAAVLVEGYLVAAAFLAAFWWFGRPASPGPDVVLTVPVAGKTVE